MSLSRHLCFAAAAAAIGLTAAMATALADADETAKGEEMARQLCANCHLNPGQGEKTSPAGIPSFHAVANRPGQSIDGVVAWLKSRPPMMPNHHLSQDEMFQLAEFILSLKDGE